MANVDPGASVSYAPPTIDTPPVLPAAGPAPNVIGLDPGFQDTLSSWATAAPPPSPYLPPPVVPLESVYAPVARAYQRGGSQDYNVGEQDVINPAFIGAQQQDVQPSGADMARARAVAQQTYNPDATPNASDLGYLPPKFIYGPNGEVRGIEGRAPGTIPEGTAAQLEQATATSRAHDFFRPLEPISRAINAGQSALDIVTVHADALIPGPGQGTLYNRYQQYRNQGLPDDQAANATMKDYGDALKTLAEDQTAGLGARGGAQVARVLGLIQSITAPAPVPGGTEVPVLSGLAAGIIRRGEGPLAEQFVKALGAAKVGDKVTVNGQEGIIDAIRGSKFDVRFPNSDVASVVKAKDVEAITPATTAGPLGRRLASAEAAAAPGPGANAALAAANGAGAEGGVQGVTDEALRKVQNATKGLTPEESTAIFGGAVTKSDVKAGEQRIMELQRERAAAGGTPVEDLPKPTHGAGGNEPTRGFQIEKFPPEVQGFMREIANGLDPALAAATRKLSHADIQTAAQLIGEPVSKVADRLAKRGVTSAEIQMVRQGVARKVAVAQALADTISKGQASPAQMYDALSALQEAATIQMSLHEAASEAGRTLGVLRTQIDPVLAANPSHLAYMAAISRIARSPEHAQAIMEGLLKAGNDPEAVYKMLRSLNKPTFGDTFASVWNLPRAIRASFDISAAGRQGLILSAAHPDMAYGAFRDQLRAFISEKTAMAIDRAIRTSPMQPLREKAGLSLTEIGPAARLTDREEAFLTNLAGKIPGLQQSERAYVTYLNKLRADRFDEAILGWERAGVTVTDARAKLLADWVNIASGRGSFPDFAKGAAPLLNGIFFSPRFAVSRFQALGYVPTQAAKALYHTARGNTALAGDEAAVAKVAARDMVAFFGANIALLGMAAKAGANIEMDPRSAEFGKIRVGDTVIDPWGGEQQIARNVAQFILGQKKTVTGKNAGQIVPIARNEVVGRFLESKLSPTAGTIWDLGKQISQADQQAAADSPLWDKPIGVDFVGNTFSAKDLVTSTGSSLVIPMAWSDVIDAVNADREAGGSGLRGAALGSLSILGLGVSTYSTEESHGASPKTRSGPDISPFHR